MAIIIAEIFSRYYPTLFDINKFNTSNGYKDKSTRIGILLLNC